MNLKEESREPIHSEEKTMTTLAKYREKKICPKKKKNEKFVTTLIDN